MRFTVTYRRSALNELARLWATSPNRRAISRASDMIDRELAEDALAKGRSFGDGDDLLFVATPLAVVYTVSLEDRLFTIWQLGIDERGLRSN